MEQKTDNMIDDVAEAGRGTDTVMAHMSLGEMVIPRAFLDDPQFMEMLAAKFEQEGANIAEFTVGDPANKINPETGYPEFFFKKIFKIAKSLAPIALSYFGTPALGAALGGGFAGSLGAGALIGGATSGLTGGNILKGAATGGLGGALNSAMSGALDNTVLGKAVSDSGLGDIYRSASGAFKGLGEGVDQLYQGSALQNTFKSGGDALKSIGIDTAGSASAPTLATGGGQSSYGPQLPNAANTPGFGVNNTQGASSVPSSNSFISPLASALLGTRANDQAEKALLDQQRANQQLLAPYTSGFSFTPGDLTQDPGYQFNLQQGQQALDRRQLAGGNYFSGQAGKELQQFGQGLADNTYESAFNRALQSRQAGLTGALAGADVNTSIGDIRGKTKVNNNNVLTGALGSLLGGNSFTNTGALQGGFDIQALLREAELRRQGASSYARS